MEVAALLPFALSHLAAGAVGAVRAAVGGYQLLATWNAIGTFLFGTTVTLSPAAVLAGSTRRRS